MPQQTRKVTLLGLCSRLMAYNLSDGAERWWVGGLPPSGKSTPVIGDGLLFLAAPDIILETSAERKDPDRAAQFYEKNAARVMAVRPGTTHLESEYASLFGDV